ncbi:hypothetical protein FBR05_05260 [Deltaproteobacteria bacterium PRO3]|nr:hypothetical protein [Deltaproteobacteria bacterium PRO3]
MSETRVFVTKGAEKDLSRVPRHIAVKLAAWIESVQIDGIAETRKIPGFHDEPLQGKRWGQRSIRLSRSYRAIYETKFDGQIECIQIQEVGKHDY